MTRNTYIILIYVPEQLLSYISLIIITVMKSTGYTIYKSQKRLFFFINIFKEMAILIYKTSKYNLKFRDSKYKYIF